MTTIPRTEPQVNPATYSCIAEIAHQKGFALGRARRSGAYPILWTDPDGKNQHTYLKSLDVVLPFIERVLAVQEGGAE